MQKLRKGGRFQNEAPFWRERIKAANIICYRCGSGGFIGRQIPAGFESAWILSDSRDRATQWDCRSKAESLLKKGEEDKSCTNRKPAASFPFWRERADHPPGGWGKVESAMLEQRKACWCTPSEVWLSEPSGRLQTATAACLGES